MRGAGGRFETIVEARDATDRRDVLAIREFNTGPARHRVVRLLLWLAERNLAERCDLFGREDLGALLGLTTETVSRTMAELKRQGYISEPRSNQFLCDVPNLRRIVE